MIHLHFFSFTLSFLFICAVAVGLVQPAHGQKTDAEIINDLLHSRLNVSSKEQLHSNIVSSTEEIRQLAKDAPEQSTLSYIILARPMSLAQIVKLARSNHLEVVGVRHSTAIGDMVYSGEFLSLNDYEGTLEEKLVFFENRQLVHVEGLIEKRRKRLSHMSPLEQTYGAFERSLKSLEEQKKLLLSSGLKYYETRAIATHANLNTALNQASEIKVIINGGSPPSFNFRKIFPRSLPKLPLRNTEVDTESDDFQSSSGIFKHDSAITLENELFPPCGPDSGGENNCPPDISWVPGLVEGGHWEYATHIQRHFFFQYTSGKFESSIIFSPLTRHLFLVNLAAYSEESLPHCDVGFGLTSPGCNNNDAVYVPSATYESEGHIHNLKCWGPRTGSGLDALLGCFVADFVFSTYPSYYLDTTLFDDNLLFNAAIGSLKASEFVPDTVYEASVEFWAVGLHYLRGFPVRFVGQIGTTDTTVPCLPGQEAFCVFSVDTRILHEGEFQ